MACRCPQCTPTPGPTWTERHRHACEVRAICAMGEGARKDYLSMVEQKRGHTAAVSLACDVRAALADT